MKLPFNQFTSCPFDTAPLFSLQSGHAMNIFQYKAVYNTDTYWHVTLVLSETAIRCVYHWPFDTAPLFSLKSGHAMNIFQYKGVYNTDTYWLLTLVLSETAIRWVYPSAIWHSTTFKLKVRPCNEYFSI
jgi:hypothetical protein